MNDSPSICLSCGLCCDGTLIGFVKLDQEELPAMRELMNIVGKNDNGFFLQPCNNYCDGCNIYTKRPKQCNNFKCGLLNSVEQNTIDFDAAIEMINKAKQLKIVIEKKLNILQLELQSQSFHFKIVELKKLLDKKRLNHH